MTTKLDLSYRVFQGGKRTHKEFIGAIAEFDSAFDKLKAHIAKSYPQIDEAQITNERKQPDIGSWEVQMSTEDLVFMLDMDKI